MADYIQKVAGSQIKVIDSREGVVKRAFAVGLNNLNDLASKNQNKPLLFVSGFTQSNDFNTYSNFCQNIGITFGGYID
jgi:glutamate racemase